MMKDADLHSLTGSADEQLTEQERTATSLNDKEAGTQMSYFVMLFVRPIIENVLALLK